MAGRRGNGEGTITRRKDGIWAGAVAIGRNTDGTTSRKWLYGSTRKEVAEKMQGVLLSAQKGEYSEQSSMLYKDWLDVWLKDYKRIVLKQTTYDSYETNIRYHLKPKIGEMKIKDIKTMDIQRFVNDIYANGSFTSLLRKLKNIVHGSLKQAEINEMISKNVCDGVILPRHVQKEVRALTREEEKSF